MGAAAGAEGAEESGGGSTPLTNWAYAPHWYEVVVLITKHYTNWFGIAEWRWPIWKKLTGGHPIVGPVVGKHSMIKGFTATLATLRRVGAAVDGGNGIPTLVGETGE